MHIRHYAILFTIFLCGVLRAQPAGIVSGRVLAEDGTPVAGAEVRIQEDSWRRTVITDKHGRFVLFGVPFKEKYFMVALSGKSSAAGILGAVYPDIPVTVEFHIYEGPAQISGWMDVKRFGAPVWFAVPLIPQQFTFVQL